MRLQAITDWSLVLGFFFLQTRPFSLFGVNVPGQTQFNLHVAVSLGLFLVVYQFLSTRANPRYYPRRTWPLWPEQWALALRILVAEAVMFAYQVIVLPETIGAPRPIVFFAAVLVLLVVARAALRLGLRVLRRQGFNQRTVLIVADQGEPLATLLQRFRGHRGYGLKLLGIVTRDPEELQQHASFRRGDILGHWDDLSRVLAEHSIDDIYITDPVESRREEVSALIRDAITHQRRLWVAAAYPPRIRGLKAFPSRFGDLTFYGFAMVQPRTFRMATKRGFDFAIAALLILLLAPLLLAVALVIKLTSPGPVFFRQRRLTFGYREFTMLKFRSMVVDAEQRKEGLKKHNDSDGPMFKMSNDPRLTRIGRHLRRTSIDELPQLVNVLRGEMSLVGPRPLAVQEQGKDEWWCKMRLSVRPGLTGLWQVEGRSTRFDDWVRHDLEYVENWSLRSDLKILARTVPVIFSRRGVA